MRIDIESAGGRQIALDTDARPYVLMAIDGLGGTDARMRTLTMPMKDGEIWLGSEMRARTISISGAIVGDDLERGRLRSELAAAVNVRSGIMRLTISGYGRKRQIEAAVESGPAFTEIEGAGIRYQEFTLSLYCPMPYFADTQDTVKHFEALEGGMKFPLRLPTGFARINVSDRYLCLNEGDASCGITAVFTSGAVNPQLINTGTGEFIRIKREVPEGKRLEITTGTGSKTARLIDNGTGDEADAMGYIDLRSTFFSLAPGANYLSFDADGGKSKTEVTLRWRSLYAAF